MSVGIKMVDGQEIDDCGNIWWWKNGVRHRTGGPAVVLIGVYKAWYHHGKVHREDGPAIIYSSGQKFWFWHGKHIDVQSQEEFEHFLKFKAFW
jgi:hypothetical protein